MNAWHELNQQICGCTRCPRLREYCLQIAREKKRAFRDADYWGLPVPNFGEMRAKLLVVGLAPAAHGGNRTGRMFTGDRSGEWLYAALHRAGFANQPESVSRDDGLQLFECAVTAICHCAPPDNKPTLEEQTNCRTWLEQTIDLTKPKVYVALGKIAWDGLIRVFRARDWIPRAAAKFGHGARLALNNSLALNNNGWLLGSYHPSQQNTFTGKLTHDMLDDVFRSARQLMN